MTLNETWLNWRQIIIADRDLSTLAKGLALYLNTFMNDQMDCAWPGQARIAGDMNMTEKTARKYLAELEEAGYLVVQKRFHSSSIYHAAIPQTVKSTLSFGSQKERFTESTGKPYPLSSESNGKLGRVNRYGLPPNKQENKQDLHNRSPSRFDEFWSVYPKKRGKADAQKAWKAKKLEVIAGMIVSDVKQRRERDQQWKDGYIPNPATYLRGQRWEDELSEEENVVTVEKWK